jgi:hypothetical protein
MPVRNYTQKMLVMWVLLVGVLLVVAAISGITIGLVAKSRHWTEKWTCHGARYGVFVLLLPVVLAQKRLGLPWPPLLLAEAGYSFVAAMANLGLILLSASLAVWLARRVAGLSR